MRIILISAVVTVLLGGLCAGGVVYALNQNTLEGSGTIVTEERPVANIRAIDMEGGHYRVVVTQGTEERLSITSDDNIVSELVAEMDGDVLEIAWEDGAFGSWRVDPTDDIVIDVTVSDLQAVDISGSSDLAADRIEGDALSVEISGSGDVTLSNLAVDALALSVAGSGDIDADGEVTSQEIEIDGSGRVRAAGLASRTAQIDIIGSGEVTVQVAESLDITISGSGDVAYSGDPVVTQDVNGSGEVTALGAAPAADATEATPAATPAATPRADATPRVTVSGAGTPRAARPATATATATEEGD